MERINHSEIEGIFSNLVLPFYAIKRDMVVAGERRHENDAEHSWSVGLAACALAPKLAPELDIGKVAQLAYVHDLVEVPGGDTSIWDSEGLKTKEQRERDGLEKLKQEYSAFPWLLEHLEEYEAKSSPEAKYVWAVDKLAAMMMRYLDYLDGGRYYKDIGLSRNDFLSGIKTAQKKAHAHPEVGKYFDEIVAKVAEDDDMFVTDRGLEV